MADRKERGLTRRDVVKAAGVGALAAGVGPAIFSARSAARDTSRHASSAEAGTARAR